jgi:uncharacterized protein (TIGR04255 family)
LSETEFPKLTHPPLREALVDIRLREDLPVSVLPKFKVPEDFTVAKEIKQGKFQFKLVEKDKPAVAEVLGEEVLGWRYEREDGSVVIQLRRNGVKYSILKNYPGWKVLREEARSAWTEFLAVSGSVNVSRLAVRYVNAIDIPAGSDYDEYLTTAPRVPKLLPQIVTNFLQRVVVPVEDGAGNVIITQTLETPSASAVLDIDVFAECSLDGASADIWLKLEKLRSIADKTFFSSLTQKVIESYQ